VRQVSRFLDELMRDASREEIEKGLTLPSHLSGNHGKAPSSGKLFFQRNSFLRKRWRRFEILLLLSCLKNGSLKSVFT
jgi:predicted ribonuclease YlaK